MWSCSWALKKPAIQIWGNLSELANQENAEEHTANASCIVQYFLFYNTQFQSRDTNLY